MFLSRSLLPEILRTRYAVLNKFHIPAGYGTDSDHPMRLKIGEKADEITENPLRTQKFKQH